MEIWWSVSTLGPDKVHIIISVMPTGFSSPNPMFVHLLESSQQDDSNKWWNIGFGEETAQLVPIEVTLMHLFWSSRQPDILQTV